MPTRRSTPRSRAAADEAPISSSHEASSGSVSSRPAPFALIVICLVIVVAVILATKNALRRPAGSSAENTQTAQTENFDVLIANVARHIAVNMSESPSIATIEDPEALRAQNPAFYAMASKGDRLLIWSDKAVLYSATEDKILAVIPLQPPPAIETTTSTPSETPEEIPTVQVRNGSGVAGLGRTMTTKIADAGMKTLAARDATVRTVYAETLIYVASGKTYPTWLPKLEQLTKGRVVTELPGEADLKGDVVVVLGTNASR
jgi:hypothetical protein